MQEEKWCSFSEHLNELRQTLIIALGIMGMGFLIVLTFYQPILHFLSQYQLHKESDLIQRKVQRTYVVNETEQQQLFKPPLGSWLIPNQLKTKMQNGTFYYVLSPKEALFYEEAVQSPLLIMGPIEGLILVFKICFWISVFLTAPLWGWILLKFITPGLRSKERSLLFPFLLGSSLALIIGVVFAYYVTLPIANHSLSLFNLSIGQNAWTLSLYINYVLLILLGHAIAAELAMMLLIVVHFGLLSSTKLIEKRYHMIVIALILGALLTPPDVLTQLLLAFPLIGLYEIAIVYAKWRRQSQYHFFN